MFVCLFFEMISCLYKITGPTSAYIFRQSLKCTRIYIHRNLFASFIINNAMWLLWYKGVADQPEVLLDNRVCKQLYMKAIR